MVADTKARPLLPMGLGPSAPSLYEAVRREAELLDKIAEGADEAVAGIYRREAERLRQILAPFAEHCAADCSCRDAIAHLSMAAHAIEERAHYDSGYRNPSEGDLAWKHGMHHAAKMLRDQSQRHRPPWARAANGPVCHNAAEHGPMVRMKQGFSCFAEGCSAVWIAESKTAAERTAWGFA